TPSQVALNWVRQQPGNIIPIVGARKLAQIEDTLGALDFTLTAEQIAGLSAISQFELGFPHDFLASDGVRDVVFGGTYAQVDNHR
ncbi:MAG TPA: aldo/keto reductase, partial [Chloroflexi bacterium]|nr:aldo/keto reductase [Chloroflexota bacterium]